MNFLNLLMYFLNRFLFNMKRNLSQNQKGYALYTRLRTSSHEEALLGKNPRKICRKVDIQDGGPYSGIVQVETVFEDRAGEYHTFYGTANVFDDQLAMTVAHNTFRAQYGHAVSIRLYRDDRVDNGGMDSHYVDAAVINYQWLSKRSDTYDFAVLHIPTRFSDGIRRMDYEKTPTGLTIGVEIYGFAYGESGFNAENVTRSLHSSNSLVYIAPEIGGLLDHEGDTEPGASGGAVISTTSGKLIAVHMGCTDDKSGKPAINHAVAINHHGNDVGMFVGIFAIMDTASVDPNTSDRFLFKWKPGRMTWRRK